jgi:hypothetical protein
MLGALTQEEAEQEEPVAPLLLAFAFGCVAAPSGPELDRVFVVFRQSTPSDGNHSARHVAQEWRFLIDLRAESKGVTGQQIGEVIVSATDSPVSSSFAAP